MKYNFRYETTNLTVSGVGHELGSQWIGTFMGTVTRDFLDNYNLLPYSSNYETYNGYLTVDDVEYEAVFAIYLTKEDSSTKRYASITGKIIDERFKPL